MNAKFDLDVCLANMQDAAGNTLAGLTILDRGYTSHEHLQSVGLISMNTRLYDPMLHRFLQVDNFIQDPTNTQNYNQYGYVLNNPLLYTDPSGNVAQGGRGDCNDCGLTPGQQTGLGNGIKTIKDNWDNWGIKDWFNRNINGDKISKWWKSKISFNNLFGSNKSSGPPPNMSSYAYINNDNFSGAEKLFVIHKFQQEINNVYGSKGVDKLAPATQETLDNMREKVPTLRNWFNKSGKPKMYAQPDYRYAPSDGISEAKTFAYDTDNYKISTITFFKSSFDSYRILAYNMLHEYGHSYFNYTGQLGPLKNKYGPYSKKPQAFSEVYAFQFAFKYGGIPYVDNAWYQVNNARKD